MERIREHSHAGDRIRRPAPVPIAPQAAAILELQRTAGNRAVARLAAARLNRRVAAPVALDGDSTMESLIDAVTDELIRSGTQEQALGRAYVRKEVWDLLLCDDALDGIVLQAIIDDATHTLAAVTAPVRTEVRSRRDARHLRWLNRAKADFDATISGPDKRAGTLRSHDDLTATGQERQNSRHYRALDATLGAVDPSFGGQEILWRFTSQPAREEIVIGPDVDFERLQGRISEHTGGNRKDDPEVRTLSFGRNLGALVGVAYSRGGDPNVAAIAVNAEYLYGVPIASLAGQGITAHPAESRLIGIFETEYVLVGTPGDPARRLEQLATFKYRNPFKQHGPLLDGKQLPVPDEPAPVPDAPSTGLRPLPAGFSDAVKAEARKVQAAANQQAEAVRDKERTDGHLIDAAMRKFNETLTNPTTVPVEPPSQRRPQQRTVASVLAKAPTRPVPTKKPPG